MNKQAQWLFEAPPTLEATLQSNPYTDPEYFNPEWEDEWEIQEANPYSLSLRENEWEMRETLKLPRRPAIKQQFLRKTLHRRAQSIRGNSPQGSKPKLIATIDRFEFGSYLLKKRQFEQLHDLVELLAKTEKFSQLQFAGHTDNIGGESKSNLLLSARRAIEVESFIRRRFEKFTPQTQVAIRGSTEPIATNTTENGRSQNRRVEVFSVTPQ